MLCLERENDDAVTEGNETLVLTLSNPANAALGSRTAHTITIVEGNVPPSISLLVQQNIFVGPLVVMRSVENYTVPLALRSMQSPNNTEWGALMAGSAIAMLPLLVVFVFSARRLVAGLTSGAVRG